VHRHTPEDEYSFILEGRWRSELGEQVVFADSGDFVYKLRDVWHTFWNATSEPARLLEISSPSGFQRFSSNWPALRERGRTTMTPFRPSTRRKGSTWIPPEPLTLRQAWPYHIFKRNGEALKVEWRKTVTFRGRSVKNANLVVVLRATLREKCECGRVCEEARIVSAIRGGR
jgi:Cupin domain